MKLRCDRLEDRNAAVAIDLQPLLGIDREPEWNEIATAITSLADRLKPPPLSPLGDNHLEFTAWGSRPAQPLPADTVRVYVGPATDLSGRDDAIAEAAPGGWQSPSPLPRSWGGWIGIDLDALRESKASPAAVAQHELLHTIGVGHTADPVAVSYPFAPTVDRDLAAADADAIEGVGWAALPRTAFPDRDYVRVYGIGTTPGGWAYGDRELMEATYPQHRRGYDPLGDPWALWPA